ncbi:hypothetical protein [Calothrix sp. PCC 6303]|uniref:hypothetical protein n=1 Tax=Calothrix sp. PCC 6303 TaxID=1170562 RepID=UPI0002A005F0|nr:hypothetical protein [Calothrix sp. PCC 6303]AFZ04007.1 hypothetical protein Cal6303_5118 [Calothrix sp. PCC 6303]
MVVNKISYRQQLRYFLALAVTIIVSPQPSVVAQTQENQTSVDDISTKQVTIDPLRANEILSKETGTANNLQELLSNPTYQKISRDITWKKRVQMDRLESPLQVTYKLQDKSGQSNRFNNNQNSTSILDVVFKNSQSSIIFRDDARNLAIVEGTVTLEFDSSRATAGEHKGDLVVCVKSRDGGCL